MSKKSFLTIVTILVMIPLVLSACTSATPIVQTVEVIKEVEKTVEVVKEVESTVEVEVEVTAVPEEVEEGPVELVIWGEGTTAGQLEKDAATDPTAVYAHMLVEGFNEKYPNITVKFENHGWDEELRQNLTNALLAGTGPDIIVGEGFFKNFAALDALLPLDDYIADIKDNAIFGTYQGAYLNGKIYGLASFTSVFGFERNCDVITAAGLDCNNPPKTWDELLTQAQAITAAGAGNYYGYTLQGPAGFSMGSAFRMYVYLLQAGASMSKEDATTGLDVPYFNDPAAVPVYSFLYKLSKTTPPGLLFEADEGKVYTELFLGRSAYQMAGGWHVTWAKTSGCTNCQYSNIPLPEGGTDASVAVANVIYGVMKTTKHPEEAIEWIRYTQTDEVQAQVFVANGRIPTTRTALEALRPSVDPATQSFIDIMLNNQNIKAMPQWSKNSQKVWQAYNDFLTKLFMSEGDLTDEQIQTLMDEAQAAAEAAMQ